MRILVTGGAGFIGSHITERLVVLGHEVRILDNFVTGRRCNVQELLGDVELFEGDIQSYESVHDAVAGCDVVLHQAALPSVIRSVQDPLTSNATNVTGTLNVLLATLDAGVRRVVFASSSSVYGTNPPLPTREDATPCPISPYATAKLAGEGYCRSFAEVHGLETVALRYFNVFGPRQDPGSQYAAVIPSFIGALLAGRAPKIFGDGQQCRDFTFVDDVVEANLLAMHAPGVSGQVFNVARGERMTVNQVLDELRHVLDSSVDPVHGPPRPAEVRHSFADISRSRSALGWEPCVNLREGLRRTIEHFESDARRGGVLSGGLQAKFE